MPLQNMKAIQTVTVGAGGAASIDFTNIPQTYTDLHLLVSLREESSTSAVAFIKFNNATANRSERYIQGNGSSATSGTTSVLQFIVCQPSDTASTFGNASIYIPNYTSSNFKSVSSDSVSENNATSAFSRLVAGLWADTSAINQITITTDTGDVAQYSTATLYGVSNTIDGGVKAYGGSVYQDANYYYHLFTASGTFTPTQSITADCLVIAGGGSGFVGKTATYYGAGGGAGEVKSSASQALTVQNYTVTVGAGGAAIGSGSLDTNGNSGTSSAFGSIISSTTGGGGGLYNTGTGGSSGNGFTGGGPNGSACGGGAGSGANGSAAPNSTTGGAGGTGVSTISGIGDFSGWLTATSTGVSGKIAGGGGGSANNVQSSGGAGGAGGGGTTIGGAFNGVANTGSGGSGGLYLANNSGQGGSGIVIVRYAK
jgi:hypothetical protein